MIYVGGGVIDCIKATQDKVLPIIYPFTGKACLNEYEHRLLQMDNL